MSSIVPSDKFDLFLSYKWNASKSKVYEIHDELKKHFKIWIYRVNMTGGYIDSLMQNGINNSSIVICFVTKDYSDFANSANCRKEFNYVVTTRKPIVYVVLEDIRGKPIDEVLKMFNTVGLNMAGMLFHRYDQIKDLDPIKKDIEDKLLQFQVLF